MLTCLHSIEHFGLGAYGDDFDAFGDHKAAKEIARVIKPGGTLVLTTTVTGGPSYTVFDAHRVYGLAELHAMFSDFDILEERLFSKVKQKFIEADQLTTDVKPYGWDLYLLAARRKGLTRLEARQATALRVNCFPEPNQHLHSAPQQRRSPQAAATAGSRHLHADLAAQQRNQEDDAIFVAHLLEESVYVRHWSIQQPNHLPAHKPRRRQLHRAGFVFARLDFINDAGRHRQRAVAVAEDFTNPDCSVDRPPSALCRVEMDEQISRKQRPQDHRITARMTHAPTIARQIRNEPLVSQVVRRLLFGAHLGTHNKPRLEHYRAP